MNFFFFEGMKYCVPIIIRIHIHNALKISQDFFALNKRSQYLNIKKKNTVFFFYPYLKLWSTFSKKKKLWSDIWDYQYYHYNHSQKKILSLGCQSYHIHEKIKSNIFNIIIIFKVYLYEQSLVANLVIT